MIVISGKLMDLSSPGVQTTLGGALVTSPWWVEFVNYISLIAGAVSMVTGAIIGVYGVYRIFKGKKPDA